MQTAMQSVSTSGVDPFLGQGGNSLESHARQNSGDSGLGELTLDTRALCRIQLLTVKRVFKLLNVSDDLKWTTNTHVTPFSLTFKA